MVEQLPKITKIAGKEIKPKEIVLIVSQQDSLVRSGHEDLRSNHLLAEIICGNAAVSVGLNLRHPRMRICECLRLKFHQLAAVSRRFVLKRCPWSALSTNLIRTGI